jgi:hypothetical protein
MSMKLKQLTLAVGLWSTITAVQAQTQTVTYRMYLFDPSPARIPQVVQAVDETLSSLGRIEKSVGLLPTPLPTAPGAPAFKTIQFGPVSQKLLDCDNAYARMHIRAESSVPMGFNIETYTGCVYPTLAGTRIALVFNRSIGGRGIFGDIVKGITKSINGDDAARSKKITSDMLASLRKALPELLVDLVELPGEAPQRPDGAEVDRLLAAVAPSAPVAAAPATPAAATGMTAAIEARRQLTAMGLVYHAVDAFHDAIRRGDAIAVNLFLDAAGIATSAKGKDGLSAAEVAAGTGNPAMVEAVARSSR